MILFGGLRDTFSSGAVRRPYFGSSALWSAPRARLV